TVVYTGAGGSVVIADKKFSREGGVEVNAAFTTDITEGTNATVQVKTGILNASPLPGVIADQADIWVALKSGSDPAKLKFTAEESSANLTYSWTSGNEYTANTRDAEFTYDTTGFYTVRLDISNTTTGDVGTSSKIIAVRDSGVTALSWVKKNSSDKLMGYIAKTKTGLGLIAADGGWVLQDDIPSFGIVFKVVITDVIPNPGTYSQVKSKVNMVNETWYHTVGVFNDSGTNDKEMLRIYINGSAPDSQIPDNNPTRKIYFAPTSSTINTNPLFNISSYSEVPFPLRDEEIAFIYLAELGYSR
ncbi:MAG TPA: hypothetical protein VJY43_06090, partial [Methanocorpusculum sp.]|nr:hypothetical protein [Methanocorpusculum sp.]